MGKITPRWWDWIVDAVRRAVGKPPRFAWPHHPGACVKALGAGRVGTLGCFVRCRKKPSEWFALTCAHVVGSGPEPRHVRTHHPYRGRPWRQPYLGVVDADRTKNLREELDVAAIRINRQRGKNVIPEVGGFGGPPMNHAEIVVSSQDGRSTTRLDKWGATTGLTRGRANGAILIKIFRKSPESQPPDSWASRFVLRIEIAPFEGDFCSEGDSGSLVFSPSFDGTAIRPVGLLFSRSKTPEEMPSYASDSRRMKLHFLKHGYCITLAPVIDACDVEFPNPP